jgi:hypothetical protein
MCIAQVPAVSSHITVSHSFPETHSCLKPKLHTVQDGVVQINTPDVPQTLVDSIIVAPASINARTQQPTAVDDSYCTKAKATRQAARRKHKTASWLAYATAVRRATLLVLRRCKCRRHHSCSAIATGAAAVQLHCCIRLRYWMATTCTVSNALHVLHRAVFRSSWLQ